MKYRPITYIGAAGNIFGPEINGQLIADEAGRLFVGRYKPGTTEVEPRSIEGFDAGADQEREVG